MTNGKKDDLLKQIPEARNADYRKLVNNFGIMLDPPENLDEFVRSLNLGHHSYGDVFQMLLQEYLTGDPEHELIYKGVSATNNTFVRIVRMENRRYGVDVFRTPALWEKVGRDADGLNSVELYRALKLAHAALEEKQYDTMKLLYPHGY